MGRRGLMGWDGTGFHGVGWDGMGWGGMGRDGTEWDAMGWGRVGWAGMGWDGVGWGGMGFDGVGCGGVGGWGGMGFATMFVSTSIMEQQRFFRARFLNDQNERNENKTGGSVEVWSLQGRGKPAKEKGAEAAPKQSIRLG